MHRSAKSLRTTACALGHSLRVYANVLLALLLGSGSALAGEYYLLPQWPSGIRDRMFEMNPDDEPVCRQILSNLNRPGKLPRRYSWQHPPQWKPPIKPVAWTPLPEADVLEVLKAIDRSECQEGRCSRDPSFWDSEEGRKRFSAIVSQNKTEISKARIIWSKEVGPVEVIRVHDNQSEDRPTAGQEHALFNSRFYSVVAEFPLKVMRFNDLTRSADILEIGEKMYFYGFSDREFDNAWQKLPAPQSLITVGRVYDGPGKRDKPGIVKKCVLAYRRGPDEPKPKRPLDPSFDCEFASAPLDKFICDNRWRGLGDLDSTMAEAYAAVRAHSPDKDRTQLDQRRWLAHRAIACPLPKQEDPDEREERAVTCLMAEYEKQIAFLRELSGPNDPFKDIRYDRRGAVSARANPADALEFATAYGDLLTVRKTLQQHPGLDLGPALYTVAVRGDLAFVQLLVNAGANPNAPRSFPRSKLTSTPLRGAAYADRRAVVQFLLDHGGNIFVPAPDRIPVLHLAVMTGREALVRRVLEQRPNLNERESSLFRSNNLDGPTALMVASERGHRDIVRILLDAGADPNIAASDNDETALMYAAWKAQDPEIVKLLLAHGAEMNARSHSHGPG